ncbi:MAG: helix-turn-helix transcriptional regulator [Treponema sp.]|nr:helix-turn-helix transcriptional regulator [Treponema sp.]
MSSIFKDNLRSELNYHDISLRQLSDTTGIPYRTIENYLSARETMPTADAAVKIAKALNTTVEFLITGSNQKDKLASNIQKSVRLFSKLSEADQTTFIRLMEGILRK